MFGGRASNRPRNSLKLGGRPEPVAVLDLGASTAKCLIGRVTPGVGVEVLGVGRAISRGLRAGAVVDMDAAERTIRAAVEEAERMAGTPVSALVIGFSGGHLASRGLYGETTLGERPAGDRDLRRALDAAMQTFDAEGRAPIHRIPLQWSIDAHRGVRDPRGMFGARLGVEVHVVSAGETALRNLQLCVERARLSIASLVAAPYAAGLATLVEDETDLGVTLIDMGASSTSAAVFIEGSLVHVDAAPVGGSHISSDLARQLSTPVVEAEHIKRRWGGLLEREGDAETFVECAQLGGAGFARAPRSYIRDVAYARFEETIELIGKRLAATGMLRAAGPRIVLTGGASQLEGAAELAGQILGKRARVARPMPVAGLPEGDDGPDMATVVGLLRYALSNGPDPGRGGMAAPNPANDRGPRGDAFAPMRQAAGWLKANF